MTQDIQQYIPGLYSNSPITISAKHIVGSGGATRTIAPLSSGFAADYNTDGVADDVEIQAAIDAVNVLGGGIIFLRAGTYNIATPVQLKSNITLTGEGIATNVITGTGVKAAFTNSRPGGQPGSGTVALNPLNNIKISNFKVDASLISGGNVAIRVDNSQYVEISGLYMVIGDGFDIFISAWSSTDGGTQDAAYIWVHHNYLVGSCREDIIGGGNISNSSDRILRDVVIEDNFLVHDTTLPSASTHYNCIDMTPVNNVRFTNNNCKGSIYFGNEKDPHQYSVISNNIVSPAVGSSTAMAGIIVQDENNTLNVSGQLMVVGNLVYGGHIHISGRTGQEMVNVNVVGNTVINDVARTTNDQTATLSQRGIWVQKANKVLVSGNYCYGPSVTNNGITCDNASNCSITGNYIDGYANSLAEANTATNNLWQDNYLINASSAASTGISAGNVHYNFGLVTEAKGTATVANGATTSVVTHGLGFTPVDGSIIVTPTNSMGSATKFFVGSYTSTQFTITVNADPGATTATFAWLARV